MDAALIYKTYGTISLYIVKELLLILKLSLA